MNLGHIDHYYHQFVMLCNYSVYNEVYNTQSSDANHSTYFWRQ